MTEYLSENPSARVPATAEEGSRGFRTVSKAGNILLVDSDRSRACAPAGRAGLSSSARAGAALVLANVRYWSTVAPLVRSLLARWEQAASSIPDPALRALAGGKLREEHFNAQVAATLATLAPRAQRARVVAAIVALQVLYDYLDVLSEQPATGSPPDDRDLFAALTDAVALPLDGEREPATGSAREHYYAERAYADDGGYLQALVATVSSALAGLPSAAAVAAAARGASERCGEAQILHHESSRLGSPSGIVELREWATVRASGTSLDWQEFLAGATASVLGIHALIAAAADPGITRENAAALDRTYLSIGALSMLDSFVDREQDIATGQLSYVDLYDGPEAMASGLANAARDGVARARRLPDGAHHIVTLVGVVAYYASAPAAGDDAFARPVIARMKRELAPLIAPTLALMRGWRLAKRARRGRHQEARDA
jgi:tetraprenyl-beta-curcumene synthase